jgi:hypothetical protein
MLPTFCRVTGNSRNLPKPNYFPLLPPISPVEARRICRLMGKSVGSSEEELRHTYVPLIEFARISKSVKCHITSHADDQHHYQQTAAGNNGLSEKCRITAKHQINESYKYLYPIIGAKDANLKQLKSILDRMGSRLDTLTFQPGQRFVYQLDENHLNLVLPADMEAAVRRGEIENLLLAKDGSSVLIRLKDGPSLTLNLRPMTLPVPSDMPPLLEGGGQDDEILAKQRQIRQYKKRKISDPKKNSVLSPTASPLPEESEQEQVIIADWTDRMDKITAYHRSAANLLTIGTDWRELLYPKIDNWDFESLPAIKEEDLPDLPVRNFQPVQLPANTMSPGLILSNQVPILNEESVGFEAVPVFDEVIRPFKGKLPANFVQELDKIAATKDSSSTSQLKDLFSDVESFMFLPFIHEAGTVMTALERGRKGWMVRSEQDGVRFITTQPVVKNEDKIRAVGGMMVPVGENEERFVVGQQSSTGFVPGKMVGENFQPGCIVQNPEGVGFLPGYTFDGQFSAGQIMRDGKSSQFVNGQAVQTLFGPKFLPGRTIQTDGEGLKFVAGQTSSVDNKFHVGQIFQTVNGPTFISGVTFDTPQGARFVAGQVDMDGQFSAGQVLMDGPNGTPEFTMGENVETADGPLFLAGQSYKTKDGRTRFCPGRQMVLEDGQKRFVPGETMLTKEGTQFVAGILAEERFVPCKIDATQNNQLLLAAKEEEVFFRTGVSDGLPIDNSTFTAMPRKKPDMGYMIQVDEKVKFLPTEQGHDELMVGTANAEDVKVVPGQLMEMDDTPKFIPGKSIESALGSIFIPGQAVRTGPSKIEQFVPGQVIDTGTSKSAEGFTGPIFCPGTLLFHGFITKIR